MGWIETAIPDDYSKTEMIVLGAVFLVLAVVAVALRLWAKILARKSIRLDDYLVIGAMAFAVGLCTTQIVGAIYGDVGQHEADSANAENDPRFQVYEKCKFAVNILCPVGLGFVKASILVFYMSIFRGPIFDIVTKCLLALVVAWSIAFFFTNLFVCIPVTPYIEPFYGNNCMDNTAMWYGMVMSDVFIDCIIFAVPIPNVLKLHLPLKQKLGVIAMFFTGASVLAVSVTRVFIYFHTANTYLEYSYDETYHTSGIVLWSVIELSSAVFCACLPLYRPIAVLCGRCFKRSRYEKNDSTG